MFINPGLVTSNALKVYYDMLLYDTLKFTNSSFTQQGRIRGINGALEFTSNGSLVAYMNSSQRVGIGTSTDIHSLLTLSGNTNSYTTAPIISFNSTSTANANVRNWAIGPADSAYGNFHIYKSSARGESAISTAESVMVIDYTGKVGIGVGIYTVSEKLDVHGNAYLVGVGSALKFDTTGAIGSNGIKTINDYETLIYNGRGAAGHVVVGNSNIRLGFGTNYTNAEADVIINTSGIVLIGTDTVAYSGTDLHIGNTSDSQNGIQIQTSTTGYGYILFGDGSGASAYRGQISYNHNNDKFSIVTAGAARMSIDSNGDGVFNYNLGVGISPTYDLDVNGVGAFGTGNYRTYVHGDGNGSFIEFGTNADNDSLGVLGTFASSMIFDTNQGLGFKWRYAGGQKMRLTTGGFLGVGVDPSTLLHLKSTSPIITIEDSDIGGDHGIDFVPTGYSSRGSIFMNYTNAELRYSAGISGNTYFQSFYTNGTERARFTTDGKFLVECTDSVTTAKIGIRQNGSSIEFGHDNQTYGYYGTLGATYSSGHPFIAFSCYNNSTVGGNNFATQGHKGNVIYGNSAGDLTFGQATTATSSSQGLTSRMTLKNSGNFLIGTTAQYFSEKLVVNGLTRTLGLHVAQGVGYSNYGNFTHDDNNMTISTTRVSGSGDIILQPYGDVRVEGASLWLNKNNAASNYYLRLNKRDGQDGGILWYRSNSLDFQVVNSGSSGNLIWYSYGTSSTVMTLDKSTGHLTIGDSSYSASNGRTLQVVNSSASIMSHVSYDTVLIQQNDAPTLRIYESGDDIATTISSDVIYSTIATTDSLRFYTNGSSTQTAYNGLIGSHVMTMDTGARVLIGQTSNLTNQKLQVNGYH